MSNLRKLYNTPVPPKVEVVEYEGESYILEGRADSYLLDVQMMPANVRRSTASLWKIYLEQVGVPDTDFPVSDSKDIMFDKVQQVLFVHHYLKPPEPEGDEEIRPYEPWEIARLSVEHGMLFIDLFTRAFKMMKPKGGVSTLDEIAAGNSNAQADSTPISSSVPPAQPESTPTP